MLGKLRLLMVKNKEFYTFLNKRLKIVPRKLELYELAFLHRSASVALPDGGMVNNERLEYLGDAIISAVIADYLFRMFPNEKEGFLTRIRSKIVNRAHLDSIANQMDLVQALTACTPTKENLKKRISGEALEALMGALYVDRGYDVTHRYITEHIMKNYVDMDQLLFTETDFKSRLMEWGQKYRMQVGFDTNEKPRENPKSPKQFVSKITISNVPIAKGTGKSKKDAEQMAAQKTLTFISGSSTEDFSIEALIHYLERMKEKDKLNIDD